MKIQKANSILKENSRIIKGNRVAIPSAILCLMFIMSCSLIGEPQPSPTATADSSGAAIDGLPSPSPTMEPSPTVSSSATPTVTRTRKPTRTVNTTPTDVFDCCSEVAGMTPEEARTFYYRIIDCVTNNKRKELAGMVYYPISVYFGENRVTISNADQFVANYDPIINQRVGDAVLNQKEEDLHFNYQGVGFTHGEIWFGAICYDQTCEPHNIYIIAINNYRGAW